MVWARMLWLLCALGTRWFSWFVHGCSGYYCALGTRTLLWFGHGCSVFRALSEHERYFGLCMDALLIVRSWKTNIFWFGHGCSVFSCALVTQRLVWFGLEHERYYGLGMAGHHVPLEKRTLSWFRHRCSGYRVLLENEHILVWAWMLCFSCALGTRTMSWFGHGCSGFRVLREHERYYGSGMDALVNVCSWNTNVIMASTVITCARTRTSLHGFTCSRMHSNMNVLVVWARRRW